jgi:hypothetical protein
MTTIKWKRPPHYPILIFCAGPINCNVPKKLTVLMFCVPYLDKRLLNAKLPFAYELKPAKVCSTSEHEKFKFPFNVLLLLTGLLRELTT